MRTAATFRQRDLTAAVKAVLRAGLEVARAEVEPNGRIVVVTTKEAAAEAVKNPWDRVFDE